ncbi:hypothetical protein [Zhihengliuella halotolerans]|uniref:hypothetical protein n=1 Tax=Zhihengliuella halotolerans TaxID=370736 RepID=UPI0015E10CF3|nr:hypothetical protein [Zhihengliuella halotolerans]
MKDRSRSVKVNAGPSGRFSSCILIKRSRASMTAPRTKNAWRAAASNDFRVTSSRCVGAAGLMDLAGVTVGDEASFDSETAAADSVIACCASDASDAFLRAASRIFPIAA